MSKTLAVRVPDPTARWLQDKTKKLRKDMKSDGINITSSNVARCLLLAGIAKVTDSQLPHLIRKHGVPRGRPRGK